MNRTDAVSKDRILRPLGPEELPSDAYEGVDLAPTTLESLVTWDVSGHARRDQERLTSAAIRIPDTTQGDR